MAAPTTPALPGAASAPPASGRRRIARWRPPVALAAVVLGLVGGQALSLALSFGFGGEQPGVVDGLGMIAAAAIMAS